MRKTHLEMIHIYDYLCELPESTLYSPAIKPDKIHGVRCKVSLPAQRIKDMRYPAAYHLVSPWRSHTKRREFLPCLDKSLALFVADLSKKRPMNSPVLCPRNGRLDISISPMMVVVNPEKANDSHSICQSYPWKIISHCTKLHGIFVAICCSKILTSPSSGLWPTHWPMRLWPQHRQHRQAATATQPGSGRSGWSNSTRNPKWTSQHFGELHFWGA